MSKTIFKKYQCRYFDRSNAQPSLVPCVQGDSCSFVHPSDSNWPGLPPTTPTKPVDPAEPARLKTASSTPPHHTRAFIRARGPPLAPQSDLFRRCSGETGDISLDDQWTVDRRREPSRMARRRSQSPETRKGHIRRKQNVRQSFKWSLGLENAKNADLSSNAAESSKFTIPGPPNSGGAILDASIRNSARFEKLLALFGDLARQSSLVLQDTTTYNKEGQKFEAFTELESTLAKLSPSAGATVAPTIASIFLKQAEAKQRLEGSVKIMSDTWTQVYDLFLSELLGVVGQNLEAALEVMHEETELAVMRIQGDDIATGSKSVPLDAALQEMKARMEEQARSLEALTKENNELKTRLDSNRSLSLRAESKPSSMSRKPPHDYRPYKYDTSSRYSRRNTRSRSPARSRR